MMIEGMELGGELSPKRKEAFSKVPKESPETKLKPR